MFGEGVPHVADGLVGEAPVLRGEVEENVGKLHHFVVEFEHGASPPDNTAVPVYQQRRQVVQEEVVEQKHVIVARRVQTVIPNSLSGGLVDAVLPVDLYELAPRDRVLCPGHEVVDRDVGCLTGRRNS